MEASEKFAKEQGWELVETLSDIGVSAFKGKNAEDGALSRFIHAAETGEIQPGSVLIIESLDRLSRDKARKALTQFNALLDKGVEIFTLSDRQHYTPNGVDENPTQLFITLGVMLRANEESEIKSKRIKASWDRKKSQIDTFKLTRMAPSWLHLNDARTEYVVIEEKAEAVRKVFELCAGGMGLFLITKHMNDHFSPISRADVWHQSYVAKLLANESVLGRFHLHKTVDGKRLPSGQVIEGYFPQIVSDELFYLANAKKHGRRLARGRKGRGLKNLFSGLCVCEQCGNTVLFRNKGVPPKGFNYLRCERSLMTKECDSPAWRYDEFERTFFDFVNDISFAEIFSSDEHATQEGKLRAEVFETERELAQLMQQHEVLVGRLATLNLPEATLVSLSEKAFAMEQERSVLEGRLADLKEAVRSLEFRDDQADQKEFLTAYETMLRSSDEDEVLRVRLRMAEIIRSKVEKIVICNNAKIAPSNVQFPPFELGSLIGESLSRAMKANGVERPRDVVDFLNTRKGRRFVAKHERFFVVCFKNGVRRSVRPSSASTLITRSEREAAMRSRRERGV